MAPRRIPWMLMLASAMGCSGKRSHGDGVSPAGDSTPTGDATTANVTVTGSSTAITSASSGAQTASGGASATSPSASSSSSGSNTSNSASNGGGLGGEAGADTTGGPTQTVDGDHCSFTLSQAASDAIGTVHIVTWSTDLPNVAEAHLEFGLTGSALEMTAPVDLAEPGYRTLLLGMKGARAYGFRIVASSGATTCTSPELSFTTGPVPAWVPTITKAGSGANAAQGFIITTSGLLSSMPGDGGVPGVYIFDTDGDVVWWAANEVMPDLSSARMSWDGKTMYSVSAYASLISSVSMDGLVTRDYPELRRANHDLVVLPGGGIATMIAGSNSGSGVPHSFVEMRADGSIVTIVSDLETLLDTESMHPNAVHYYPDDDTFTLSELSTSSIVKFTRTGELVWQVGGDAPLGDSFDLVDLEGWELNHGHHLTEDDRLLIFSNRFADGDASSRSRVLELLLDDDAWTATKTWEYSQLDAVSEQLGDVQRLPNGNVLITYSNRGKIVEITPSGEIVQSFDSEAADEDATRIVFGYASFRTSLYGPPPR